MKARIINGKEVAATIRETLKEEIRELITNENIIPGLAVILVGSDPASQVYVRMKDKACQEVGIRAYTSKLPKDTSETDLLNRIRALNADPAIHGILVQLPLPPQIREQRVIETISPDKDVDGFHPVNVGQLVTGTPLFKPCTPWGVMELLKSAGVEIKGKEAVVVGRSNIVGKPVALMLLAAHATVTICHSRTVNLTDIIARADIIIAAAGRPKMIRKEAIKPGAVIIDVGTNRLDNGKLCGDVDFEEAVDKAAAITPVPGGVGPMTITMLLKNTVESAKRTAGDH